MSLPWLSSTQDSKLRLYFFTPVMLQNMPSVPLPFILSLFMLILFARLFLSSASGMGAARLLVGCCTLLTVIVGLRWTTDFPGLHIVQRLLAILPPVLAWNCFTSFNPALSARKLKVLLPLTGAVVIQILYPQLTDPLLILLYSGHGFALLFLARKEAGYFTASRLSDLPRVNKSVKLAGVLLLGRPRPLTGSRSSLLNGYPFPAFKRHGNPYQTD